MLQALPQKYYEMFIGLISCNSPINDHVIFGDFKCDLMKSASMNKINSIALSYNLHQLIDEAPHYTENSSSLIDLIFVSKPENVLYSDVISPFIHDLVMLPSNAYIKI